MKKYLENYYKGLINGLGFLTVLGITGVAYGAYVAISDVAPNDTLTASTFNQVLANIDSLNTTVSGLANVPAGAVMAFNLSSCPSGWTVFTSGNGRVLVGVGSDGQGNTYSLLNTGGEARHTLTTSEIPSHNHPFTDGADRRISSGAGTPYGGLSGGSWQGNSNRAGVVGYTGGGQSHENRMPYIALLYCVKQ